MIVATRKTAARVSRVATDWDTGGGKLETMSDEYSLSVAGSPAVIARGCTRPALNAIHAHQISLRQVNPNFNRQQTTGTPPRRLSNLRK
ncbi:MAG TPA: hypothetical protein VJ692_04775, partial [Nitrospiraceae bacterium]|nr:hypothetical protein [Nitrospiraceae bacterium]